jgi:hypothetical protein
VRYATPRPLPSRTKVVKRRLRRGPLGFTGSEQAAGPAPIQASPPPGFACPRSDAKFQMMGTDRLQLLVTLPSRFRG